MSTKSEGKYLAIFLLLSVLLVIIQIILKTLYGSYSSFNIKNIFKSNDEIKYLLKQKNINYDNNLVLTLKSLPIIYSITLFILFIGVYKYYIRQRKDHFKDWNFIKFVFGNNNCRK